MTSTYLSGRSFGFLRAREIQGDPEILPFFMESLSKVSLSSILVFQKEVAICSAGNHSTDIASGLPCCIYNFCTNLHFGCDQSNCTHLFVFLSNIGFLLILRSTFLSKMSISVFGESSHHQCCFAQSSHVPRRLECQFVATSVSSAGSYSIATSGEKKMEPRLSMCD